jgi:hypothetical protein
VRAQQVGELLERVLLPLRTWLAFADLALVAAGDEDRATGRQPSSEKRPHFSPPSTLSSRKA